MTKALNLDEDEEATELDDPEFPRVDAVKGPATGLPVLIMKGLETQPRLREAVAKALKSEDDVDKAEHGPFDGEHEHEHSDMDGGAHEHPHDHDDDSDHDHDHESEDAEKAVWTTKYKNSLPDSSFAYISPGGKKVDGKTVPRSLRHYPIRDADGKPDPAHVRNALARAAAQIENHGEGEEEARKAMPKIKAAARELGIGDEDKEKAQKAADSQPMPNAATAGPDVPGSAAWEAQDAERLAQAAATLEELRQVLALASSRETAEANSALGDDQDADNALDLCMAAESLEYVLGVVASLAVHEQLVSDSLSGSVVKASVAKHTRTSISKADRSRLLSAARALKALAGEDDRMDDSDKARKAEEDDDADKARKARREEDDKARKAMDEESDKARKDDDDDESEKARKARKADDEEEDEDSEKARKAMDDDSEKARKARREEDDKARKDDDDDDEDVRKAENLLESVIRKQLADPLKRIEERLEKVEKQAEAPKFRLRNAASGPASDWYFTREEEPRDDPALAGAADTEAVTKALDSMKDPMARDLITRELARSLHPLFRKAED